MFLERTVGSSDLLASIFAGASKSRERVLVFCGRGAQHRWLRQMLVINGDRCDVRLLLLAVILAVALYDRLRPRRIERSLLALLCVRPELA